MKESKTIAHKCMQCGRCCRNRNGIYITPYEVLSISQHLNISCEEFIGTYCGFTNAEPYIKWNEDDKSCLFLKKDEETGKTFCSIYDVRPLACYLYPLGVSTMKDDRPNSFTYYTNECPATITTTSAEPMTYMEFAKQKSNGRYPADFWNARKSGIWLQDVYDHGYYPHQIIEYLYLNSSAKEIDKKLNTPWNKRKK